MPVSDSIADAAHAFGNSGIGVASMSPLAG